MPEVIVVGLDGSENAWHALDWAVTEAKLRGASLQLVSSFEDPMTTVGLGTAFGTGAPIAVDPDLIQHAAQDVVDEGTRRVGDAVPVTGVARCDSPDEVLCEASQSASLLVVGARGHGPVGSLLLGSVSNHVVHHSKCPVVVVPTPK